MKDYNSRRIPNRRLLQRRRKLLKQGTIRKFFFRTFRTLLFLFFVLITSILFNSLGNFIVHSSWLSLKDVRFEGCQHVTPQELMKLAGVKKGMNIFDLNLEKVAQRLKGNPWVKEVKIKRVFPHRLQISIKERIPVALAYHKRLLLVDNEGVLFKEVERDDDIDMPVITGLSSFKPTINSVPEICF